jgi:hypothetical protein
VGVQTAGVIKKVAAVFEQPQVGALGIVGHCLGAGTCSRVVRVVGYSALIMVMGCVNVVVDTEEAGVMLMWKLRWWRCSKRGRLMLIWQPMQEQ